MEVTEQEFTQLADDLVCIAECFVARGLVREEHGMNEAIARARATVDKMKAVDALPIDEGSK